MKCLVVFFSLFFAHVHEQLHENGCYECFFLCGFISNVRGDSEESENKLYNNYKSVPHREKRNEQQNTHTHSKKSEN